MEQAMKLRKLAEGTRASVALGVVIGIILARKTRKKQ